MNDFDNSHSYKVNLELQDFEDEISTEIYAQDGIPLLVIFFTYMFIITAVFIYADLTLNYTRYHIPFHNVSSTFYNITLQTLP